MILSRKLYLWQIRVARRKLLLDWLGSAMTTLMGILKEVFKLEKKLATKQNNWTLHQ